jgi:hypothetical protein
VDTIFPDAGLLYILRQTVGTALIYDLYRNNYTPTLSSALVDFQRANWSGYAPVTIPAVLWTVQMVAGNVGRFQAPIILFGNSSATEQAAYGYYVKDATNTVLIAAGRFDLAPVIIPRGGAYPVLPLLGAYSGLKS